MIRELKTLLVVAREGTFAAAAHKVGLTQAAVSAQMQRLEQSLGFELFDRVGRAARLNSRGELVCQQAGDLLARLNGLGVPAESFSSNVLINVGAIASVQRSFLPDVLARFHELGGGGRVRVIPGVSMDLVNRVDAGEVDLAIVIKPPFTLPVTMQWFRLAREPYRLLVHCDLKGEDWQHFLQTLPFIRYDHASFGGRQVERFLQEQRLIVNEICELDELEAIVALVARGTGVALLPQSAVHQHWPASVRAIDLGASTFHREVGLIYPARAKGAGPAAQFLELLQAQADRFSAV